MEERRRIGYCGVGGTSLYLEDPVEVEPESCEALGEARDDDAGRQEETEGEEHEDTMSLQTRRKEDKRDYFWRKRCRTLHGVEKGHRFDQKLKKLPHKVRYLVDCQTRTGLELALEQA